ncbi:MAG: tRNA pseudouridine(55) synthase TruB [Candidatus Pacebacteria bacterium]|nr:tRNA pseudouridine(55) synthase TruB [Candidatus Paceibacterota bacterium]
MLIKQGIVGVWKPKGPTSHDIVDKVRRVSREKVVGHAGTLDPLASGVLVIAVGKKYTKQLSTQVQKEKEYIGEIKLGEESETDDAEGLKTEIKFEKKPTSEEIDFAIKKFIGEIDQTPPIYSAIKLKGKPLYEYAREGKTPELKSRKVFVKDIKVLKYDFPILKLEITTGPGVYIRSIARNLGTELKTGGYLFSLIRTRVGEFTEKDCVKL